MKTTRILTILVLVLASVASGAQKLTVNGQDISSIIIKVGQSCTVEVVSDDTASYADFLGFDGGQSSVLGNFVHLETKPEAGNIASVSLVNEPTFYGYSVWARRWPSGPLTPGVHFVFEYTGQELGETILKLYDETRTLLKDSVNITVVHSESGTAFTYQGRLIDANRSAYGLYDFEFALYDSPDVNLGNQLGGTIDINQLDVIDGLFEVTLDFGSDVFDGNARWLEIAIKPSDINDPNAYTFLAPRQEVTPTPYSLYTLRTRGVFLDAGALNTLVGLETGHAGAANTFLGYQTGYSNAGNFNTFSGYQAGYSNTWGSNNTFLGLRAGYSNTTGSGNVFIGYLAGSSETGSNKLYIANSSSTPLIYGDFSTGNVGLGTTNPTAKLEVAGQVKITGGSPAAGKVLTSDAYGLATWQTGIPSGVIVMWSGSIGSIPSGWALCNGSNGTPDLRDRFIVGAGSGYGVGSTGGEATHTLTISEMPKHKHGYDFVCGWNGIYPDGQVSVACGLCWNYTDYAGGDQPHENRPPYYALAYIMKL